VRCPARRDRTSQNGWRIIPMRLSLDSARLEDALARSAAQPRRPRQGHLRALADGSELTRLISPLKLSRSSLQIRKERLATGIRQCLGQDILLQVQAASRLAKRSRGNPPEAGLPLGAADGLITRRAAKLPPFHYCHEPRQHTSNKSLRCETKLKLIATQIPCPLTPTLTSVGFCTVLQ